MMSAKDFLVELSTEELPPKTLNNLGEAFLNGIEKGLKAASLNYATARFYAAPRRLAVLAEQLAVQQPDHTVDLDGPPLQAAFDVSDNPTQAALGFAKKCGVDLQHIDKSGPKPRFSQAIAGQPVVGLLPSVVEALLNELSVPRRMRWAAHHEEFVRPTRQPVTLFGDGVVECEILTQRAGHGSHGHRFHNPDNVRISSPAAYLEDPHGTHVLADFAERRELIARRVAGLAAEQQDSAIVPSSLLDEVTALVEWPVPLVCSFEERLLEIPQEALIATMQDNQEYFCPLDANDKLLPRFVIVANVENKMPENVVSGSGKMVRPRLTDAEFFFKQDRGQPLENFNGRLRNVVFQAQLGAVFKKAQRVSGLAAYIAERIGGNTWNAVRVGIPSKCDLATEMVGEFPKMQGIAGYHYATHGGEVEDVAPALDEQCMPHDADAELPSTLTGAAVAVTDKLDTLVGIFGIGMPLTGSKDPYALRHTALDVLRILIEKQLDLDLVAVVNAVVEQYGDKIKVTGLAEQVLDFMFDRLRARYEDEGVNVAVYQLVRALRPSSPLDFDQRIQTVQAFRQLPEAEALTAANKRMSSILAKSGDEVPPNVDTSLLMEAAERTLDSVMANVENEIAPLAAARDCRATLTRLTALRELADTFFADVIVNVDDAAVCANRYTLLTKPRGSFLGATDISLLG